MKTYLWDKRTKMLLTVKMLIRFKGGICVLCFMTETSWPLPVKNVISPEQKEADNIIIEKLIDSDFHPIFWVMRIKRMAQELKWTLKRVKKASLLEMKVWYKMFETGKGFWDKKLLKDYETLVFNPSMISPVDIEVWRGFTEVVEKRDKGLLPVTRT